jgi:hypothetical protein
MRRRPDGLLSSTLPLLAAASVAAVSVGAALPAAASGPSEPATVSTTTVDPTTVPNALRPDFNGDGFADLAVGVPGESLGSDNQGAVNVIYGSATGLTATENQLWSQDVPGVLGTGEANDRFGNAVGWGDLNGDGFDDLAVGVPDDRVAGKSDAGAVNVIYGSPDGLAVTGNQLWSQDSTGIPGEPRTFDFFGNTVISRDFNGDGFGDLAIGAFGDGKDGFPRDTGSVQVLYGSAAGLASTGNQWLHQLKGKPQRFDWFGHTLGSGDFDADGYFDLAIGAPYETQGGIAQAGAVNVMYGSPSGLQAAGNQYWHQATPGISGDPGQSEHFGYSLSVSDFNGDNNADLAIGIEQDDVGAAAGAGSAQVLYGSAAGLTSTGNQLWNQDSAAIADTAETSDTVSDVVAGDFDGDGFADLAMGFQLEDLGATDDAGAVNVIYGAASGLNASGNQFWTQDSSSVEEVAEETDWFGAALTRGDYDGDGYFDLAIGVPGESITSTVLGGAVNVVYGTTAGLAATNDQLWSQDSPGILDSSENPDFFGESVVER